MVHHFLMNHELLYEVVKKGLIENYGLPKNPNGDKTQEGEGAKKDQVGPFSIACYLEYIAVNKRWGDSVCFILI